MNSDQNIRQEISEFCKKIGKDPLLVQGPGGNASWKDGDTLWVKASGTWLANAQKEEIFVPVNLDVIKEAVKRNDFSIIPVSATPAYSLKPSIETLFHAVIPQPLIIHMHPVCVIKDVIFSNYRSRLKNKLPVDIKWAGIDYYKPGGELAKAIHHIVERDPSIQVFFLQNHGIIVGGNSINEIENILASIFAALVSETRAPLPVNFNPDSHLKLDSSYSMIPDEGIQQLAFDKPLFDRLVSDWALYPDHVVFLGASPDCVHKEVNKSDLSKKTEHCKGLIFIQNAGVFANVSFNNLKIMHLRLYYEIISRLKVDDHPNVLNDSQINELLNWDAEKYRINMAR